MDTIQVADGIVKVLRTQEVVVEEYTTEQLDNEIKSLNDEITNFQVIQDRRLTYITDRLAYLNNVKTQAIPT